MTSPGPVAPACAHKWRWDKRIAGPDQPVFLAIIRLILRGHRDRIVRDRGERPIRVWHRARSAGASRGGGRARTSAAWSARGAPNAAVQGAPSAASTHLVLRAEPSTEGTAYIGRRAPAPARAQGQTRCTRSAERSAHPGSCRRSSACHRARRSQWRQRAPSDCDARSARSIPQAWRTAAAPIP